ncbi:MAG: NAD(P)/FAD-dependent oxidoreductase, partial [Abitibacteriaceae bacterium]|nr:NAD(P)/FAD-dependent oxidoreductase [Abditibacteriaceae bacterium]
HGRNATTLGRYKELLQQRGIDFYESRVVKIIEERGDPESDYQGRGICLEDGSEHPLAVLYSALGCDLHLEPVQALGLNVDDDGYIITDINQQTSIPGIYAAGDLVSQINQISVAFGQAAIAAVRIHNELDDD